jgi:hypothetical protein
MSGTPDEIRARTGAATLEEAFVRLIGAAGIDAAAGNPSAGGRA